MGGDNMRDDTMHKILTLIGHATAEEMDEIMPAVHNRALALRAQRRSAAVRNIAVGDRVRLAHIKPKYLEGTEATVLSRKGTKFKVRLAPDADVRAFTRFGPEPICPATALEKIS